MKEFDIFNGRVRLGEEYIGDLTMLRHNAGTWAGELEAT